MQRDKRGSLESTQTGEWTLFIIAAVVLLVFVGIVIALLKGSSEEDLCKLSVLGRATTPISPTQEAVPLKCIVKKVCFSDGRGNCDDPLRGEKSVLQIKIPEVKKNDDVNLKKATGIIEEESAKKMYECWKMMGEGKLDLFNGVKTTFGIDAVSTTCVICSRLVIDKNVPEEVLNQIDVNEYLKTHVVPGGTLTYLQAFTNSKDVLGYAKFNPDVFKVDDATGKLDVEALRKFNEEKKIASLLEPGSTDKRLIDSANADTPPSTSNREIAFVFMQIKSKKATEVLKNMASAGAIVAGSAFMTPVVRPVTKLATRFAFTPLGGIVVLGTAAGAGTYGALNAWEGQKTAASYCGEFTSKEDERKGCSMVQGLSYNKNDINALCASIQGRLYEE